MATTSISAPKTISEIEELLMSHGMVEVSRTFSGNMISEMNITMDIKGKLLHYRLPVRPEKLLKYARKVNNKSIKDLEQANRTSWRIMFRWLQAQLEMIQTELVDFEEVFMPYMVNDSGETVYELYQGQQNLLQEGS